MSSAGAANHRPPVRLVLTVLCCTLALPAAAAEVTVDVQRDRRAIAPEVYGVVLGSAEQARRMGVTVRRQGGNQFSRYNFLTSTSNEGGDGKFFKNLLLPFDAGAGFANSADQFVAESRDAGADALIDLPLIGYVARGGAPTTAPYVCGFSVAKYGAQYAVDPLDPNCGDGKLTADGGFISGTDPLDTSIPVDVNFARSWVDDLVQKHGGASSGGVRYYTLGTQPALWWTTHADVHPAPNTYAEMKTKLEQYGASVKSADPGALTLGPAEWGWLGYYDSAAGERNPYGKDFVVFYLLQASAYEVINGVRILDYFDLHVFPQSPGVTAGLTDPATNALRLRSTRILWDPTYTVESWETCCYSSQQMILWRMRDWVANFYPGTKLAVGAYNWGALDHISGALAQVEVLGLFGREGVELAALETVPPDGAIGEDAFKLFRNYDGTGAQFGATSIRARSSDVNTLSAFAAYRGGTVTLVLVNKDPNFSATADITFAGTNNAGPWRAFAFSSTSRLTLLDAGAIDGGVLTRTLAPYSAELLEFIPTSGIPDAGIIDPPDGGPGDGGADAGSDAAKSVCPVAPVSSKDLDPYYRPGAPAQAGACTPAEIASIRAVTSLTDVIDAIHATSAACQACAITEDGDAATAWAPVVAKVTTPLGPQRRENFGACVGAKAGDAACGEVYQKALECYRFACDRCPAADKAACVTDVDQGACSDLSDALAPKCPSATLKRATSACGTKISDHVAAHCG